MFSEIPSSNELTQQAFQFRKEGRYAAHPVEAALRYHRAQAENTGAQSHGGFDFETAEILYRAGAQGLRFSEIPQLPQSIPELSRLASVDGPPSRFAAIIPYVIYQCFCASTPSQLRLRYEA